MPASADRQFLDRWVGAISESIGTEEAMLVRWTSLIALAEGLRHFRPLRGFVLDGRVTLPEKVSFFRDFCAQTLGESLPGSPERLIVPLIEGNLWDLLPVLLERVVSDFDRRTGQVRVEILSAAPLSGDERTRVVETVLRFVNGSGFRQGSTENGAKTLSVRPTFTVRPELLAGLEIRIGSQVWDASLAARIRELERQLLKTA